MRGGTKSGRGTSARVRYAVTPFPAYAFVPGRAPHPRRDPRGHSHEASEPARRPLGDWRLDETWRFGVDLYNHGYFWEAHEAWEALWHGEGRRGDVADFLKGLIQTTAAHVKTRQDCPDGVRILSTKARRLLEDVARRRPFLAGLDLVSFVAAQRVYFEREALPDPDGSGFPLIVLSERADA